MRVGRCQADPIGIIFLSLFIKKQLTSTKFDVIILNVASDEVDDRSLKTKQSRN